MQFNASDVLFLLARHKKTCRHEKSNKNRPKINSFLLLMNFEKKLDVARPILGIQLRFQQGKMVTSLDHSRHLSSASLCHLTIQIDQGAYNGDKLYGFLLRIFFSVLEGELSSDHCSPCGDYFNENACYYCKQFTHQIKCVLYVSFRDKGLLPVAG